jgi:hypothetical protein
MGGASRVAGTVLAVLALTLILALGAAAGATGQAADDDPAAPVATPAPAAPVAMPPPAATPPAAQRFRGALTVDGDPAPAGSVLQASVNGLCASFTVEQAGRYAIEVPSVASDPLCGAAGTTVRFWLRPSKGEFMRDVATATFTPGADTDLAISVDTKRLSADADNVPPMPVTWFNPLEIPYAVCDRPPATLERAIREGIGWWEEAHRGQGLRTRLIEDQQVCSTGARRGIAVFVEPLSNLNTLGAAAFFDGSGQICRLSTGCLVHKSILILNSAGLAALEPHERAKTVAHEFGHALGLDHAKRCTGGSIMWHDLQCPWPARQVGVDDIAALNRKNAGFVAP